MKLVKVFAAMVFMASPSVALAGASNGAYQPMPQANQLDSNPLLVRTQDSISVPNLSDLQQVNDKNDTLIQKKPLTDYQLPPTTQKIVRKLPKGLEKPRKVSKGKENLNSGSFTGEEEPASSGILNSIPAASQKFDIQINATPASSTPEDLTLASKAYLVGQYESAIAIYKRVLATNPKDRDALFGLATAYHKNRQKSQAKVYYGKLLEAYPYDTDGQNNFLALIGDEAPSDALNELKKLSAKNPDYAPIHARIAMIYMKLGDDQSAIKSLYQALRINGDNNDYKYNLAVLFDKNGYYDRASRIYGDLVQDSLRGNPIPVSRIELTERMNFLNSKIRAQ